MTLGVRRREIQFFKAERRHTGSALLSWSNDQPVGTTAGDVSRMSDYLDTSFLHRG